MEEIVKQTKYAFFEMKGDYALYWRYRESYQVEDKIICVFTKQHKFGWEYKVKCYLKNDRLMPYFGD